jgi:hypothetical protein
LVTIFSSRHSGVQHRQHGANGAARRTDDGSMFVPSMRVTLVKVA